MPCGSGQQQDTCLFPNVSSPLPAGPKEDMETELTRAGTAASLGQAQSGDTWSIKRPMGGSSHSEEQFKLFMMADGP